MSTASVGVLYGCMLGALALWADLVFVRRDPGALDFKEADYERALEQVRHHAHGLVHTHTRADGS
jgi:hypothetical protein